MAVSVDKHMIGEQVKTLEGQRGVVVCRCPCGKKYKIRFDASDGERCMARSRFARRGAREE